MMTKLLEVIIVSCIATAIAPIRKGVGKFATAPRGRGSTLLLPSEIEDLSRATLKVRWDFCCFVDG